MLEFQKPFDVEKYTLFLKAKTLPEKQLKYCWKTDKYVLITNRRYAKNLGLAVAEYHPTDLPISDFLFDYQKFIVRQALESKRYAIYADCGLGKTAMLLEFARHVLHKTSGKVLVLSPLQIIPQTIEESNRFYGVSPVQLRTRENLLEWLVDSDHAERFAITNYEKLIEGVAPELNSLGGLVCDESSILKTGGGVIKWNLVKSVKGIEYKLSCTATPAPNDIMEYASQASFLGKLRSDGEIMWTYFNRDKHGNWGIKPYARKGFYRFLSSWSIYIRNPAHYGFADNLSSIPAPEFHTIEIDETLEQKEEELKIRRTGSENKMFGDMKVGVVKRMKLSQIAKGFLYNKDKTVTRIPSRKPSVVAEIISKAVDAGRQVLVWTVFDEEGEILLDNVKGIEETRQFNGISPRLHINAKILSGKTPEDERLEIIEDFRQGKISVLISKPSLLGFGLNFQFCTAMVFSGWDDSFERFYQALKRAHRFGQTKALQVYLPVIKNLEGAILENVIKKKGNFEADAMKHEEIYKKILTETAGVYETPRPV